ncbi:MAG TPA: FAD-binding oxidoreductase, partial [Ktedonobacteraceae bacterium]|nr:FAD-binding oxidoreductase [Ktedonobacteraceae bacterium]
ALEPRLHPGLAGGLLVPGDSVVYPPSCAALLLAQASQYNTTLINGKVCELLPKGVKLQNGQTILASAIVLASGAHASELLPDLPLRPKKGHLAITDRYPGFIHHQLIELGYIKNAHASSGDSVSFNIQPRSTGQLLIGSSRQFDHWDNTIDYHILSQMLASAFKYLPSLAECNCIRTWTGLRAATPDSLPLIGPYLALTEQLQSNSGDSEHAESLFQSKETGFLSQSSQSNRTQSLSQRRQHNQNGSLSQQTTIWLATGHEGLGITTSLGTARLLAAQILGQPAPIPIEPYLPSRIFKEVEHA